MATDTSIHMREIEASLTAAQIASLLVSADSELRGHGGQNDPRDISPAHATRCGREALIAIRSVDDRNLSRAGNAAGDLLGRAINEALNDPETVAWGPARWRGWAADLGHDVLALIRESLAGELPEQPPVRPQAIGMGLTMYAGGRK